MKTYFWLTMIALLTLAIVTIFYGFKINKTADTAPLNGFDVSHWSGEIDWVQLNVENVGFIYAKSTEGSTGTDEMFEQFKSGAKSAGIPFGAYHFFSTTSDPKKQAQHFVAQSSVEKGSLPPVLDIETISNNVSKDQLQQNALIWLQEVEAATGCRPLVYASLSFYNQNMGSSLTDYGLWLAKYSNELELPNAVSDWVFWQYQADQQQVGVSGTVDLDRFNGSADDLKKLKC